MWGKRGAREQINYTVVWLVWWKDDSSVFTENNF